MSTQTVSTPPTPRYRVTLDCPTPLVHPELEIAAASPEVAWQKFCTANGITDSEHPRDIRQI